MSILSNRFIQYIIDFLKPKIEAKQDKLVSGTNIKTVNGESILGEGNINIEGGGDFNSSGTYPNLTAGKATKLATARKIGLTGGAVGTATNFDGTKDININVTSLGDLSLTRVYRDNGRADALSLADLSSAKFASNRLAFNNPDGVLIYKSNDGGTTWTDYGATNAQKTNFISGITERMYIGGKTTGQVANQDRLRIILTRNRNAYTTIEEFLILLNTNGATSCKVKLSYLKGSEYNANVDYNAQTYTEITTKQVTGWSGWNRLLYSGNEPFGASSPNNVEAFVLEFWFESHDDGYENNTGFAIYEIIGIGKTVFSNSTGCNMMNDGHLYTYDHDKNATFPANVTSKQINATNFLTALGGTATGTKTTAIGEGSNSEGYFTTAIGYNAKAKGFYTTAIGTLVEASTTYQTVIGKHNAASYHAFVIGWGTADAKKNIFSVDTSGNVYGTKFITSGGTNQQVVLGNGSLKAINELSPITANDAEILLDNHIHSIDVNANGNDVNISVIESSKNGNTWETEDNDIPIPLATTTSAGVMSKEDKEKLDSLFGMSISGTVNLTTGTFNTTNNTSLNSYSAVFNNMKVGEMRMYLVADSNGNLPSTTETAVTVPYDGVLSPAQVYFGKSAAFGVSVGDICVLFKRSSILNVCRIIPLNDVKPANGDFPGADGLSTVWDKNRINKIDGIEWTANHVRDNYLPKSDRFPSRTDWLINVNYCVDNGVYPTCDAASMQVGLVNNYVTLIVHRTSTVDNGGFDTVEQTAYGRGADEGKIYKRIIFYNGSSTEYGDWKRIDNETSVIEIKYTPTEYEYNNHEIVNLYNIVYAISNRLYNNGWLYNDDKSYNVVVKGWVDNSYSAITYANFNVRLLTTRDGHSLGINGYVDVAQITETNENADCPLWVGYICGKYHIEDDGMVFYAPENPNFIVEA